MLLRTLDRDPGLGGKGEADLERSGVALSPSSDNVGVSNFSPLKALKSGE